MTKSSKHIEVVLRSARLCLISDTYKQPCQRIYVTEFGNESNGFLLDVDPGDLTALRAIFPGQESLLGAVGSTLHLVIKSEDGTSTCTEIRPFDESADTFCKVVQISMPDPVVLPSAAYIDG